MVIAAFSVQGSPIVSVHSRAEHFYINIFELDVSMYVDFLSPHSSIYFQLLSSSGLDIRIESHPVVNPCFVTYALRTSLGLSIIVKPPIVSSTVTRSLLLILHGRIAVRGTNRKPTTPCLILVAKIKSSGLPPASISPVIMVRPASTSLV